MATDATGTPTSLGIPKYDTSTDAPSGLGFNAAMDAINTLLGNYVAKALVTTAGDLIYGTGSGAVARLPIGSTGQFLSVAGGIPTWSAPVTGMSNPMTTLADLIVGGASGTPARLAVGAAGKRLTVVSGSPAWAAAARTGVAVGAFSIAGTGSAVAAQNAGYGSSVSLTPTASGIVEITFTGTVGGNFTNTTGTFVLQFGTGAAPAAGTAASGTAVGSAVTQTGYIGAGNGPLALVAQVALTVGTTYWFDIQEALPGSQGGQNPGITSGYFSVKEVA